jgi:ABC-type phosphate/phosphonate transport system substrate-binding protein
MNKKYLLTISASIITLMFFSCTSKKEKMENKLREFITKLEVEVIPLSKDANIASWDASITGKDEDYNQRMLR